MRQIFPEELVIALKQDPILDLGALSEQETIKEGIRG